MNDCEMYEMDQCRSGGIGQFDCGRQEGKTWRWQLRVAVLHQELMEGLAGIFQKAPLSPTTHSKESSFCLGDVTSFADEFVESVGVRGAARTLDRRLSQNRCGMTGASSGRRGDSGLSSRFQAQSR